MSSVRDTDIPDLVAGVVNDARELVEAPRARVAARALPR
jgi:hypothetical protein